MQFILISLSNILLNRILKLSIKVSTLDHKVNEANQKYLYMDRPSFLKTFYVFLLRKAPLSLFGIRLLGGLAVLFCFLTGCSTYKEIAKNSIQYQHSEYNANQYLVVEGESFENNIRNGHWRFYNNSKQLIKIEQYKDNVLEGMATYIHYPPGNARMEEGLLVKGKRNGMWTIYEEVKQGKWLKTGYWVYNASEQVIARTTFYPNGRIALEIFMDAQGQPHYYKSYDKKGKLTFQGKELPITLL